MTVTVRRGCRDDLTSLKSAVGNDREGPADYDGAPRRVGYVRTADGVDGKGRDGRSAEGQRRP